MMTLSLSAKHVAMDGYGCIELSHYLSQEQYWV